MKQFVTLWIILLGTAITANAQTFLDQLRKSNPGQGTVTVTQSKAIDELINGSNKDKAPAKTTPHTEKPEGTKPAEKPKAAVPAHKTETAKSEPPRQNEIENTEEIPTVDLSKKVMRNSYKVDGYRVQAFAGGNTRTDRQEAERIRNEIKKKFPGQPVYVHFYSPRWICRVGNYRSYEEAAWMLQQLHKMGYKAAAIVKGKITVQY